jgi:hypothetical protein
MVGVGGGRVSPAATERRRPDGAVGYLTPSASVLRSLVAFGLVVFVLALHLDDGPVVGVDGDFGDAAAGSVDLDLVDGGAVLAFEFDLADRAVDAVGRDGAGLGLAQGDLVGGDRLFLGRFGLVAFVVFALQFEDRPLVGVDGDFGDAATGSGDLDLVDGGAVLA